ncbi:hypothetical protein ElyMa_001646400 [Elysia marginata]|uniref:MYND-type domain-containing protein n=1 Tax=Elysia marginata TaxID=1093978 RepID=A0AAV4JP58_9GAST|nr:hypothetical protein ElyMa_001646400 [Elysia marginata]
MDGRSTRDQSGDISGRRSDLAQTSLGTVDAEHAGKGDARDSAGRSENRFCWSYPDDGRPRRYRYPTLGSDRAAFVRARADPLACNLNNDMVLLWNDVDIDHSGQARSGNSQSDESIEDAYERLFASVVRHREDLRVTLRDAGLDRVNDLFTAGSRDRNDLFTAGSSDRKELFTADSSDSACGALDDAREDIDADEDEDDDDDDDDDDDVFDDSGVRGSWELLSEDADADVFDTENGTLDQNFGTSVDHISCLVDGIGRNCGEEVSENYKERNENHRSNQAVENNFEEHYNYQQQRKYEHALFEESNSTTAAATHQNRGSGFETTFNRNETSSFTAVSPEMKNSVPCHNSSRLDSGLYGSSGSIEDVHSIVDTTQHTHGTLTAQGAHSKYILATQGQNTVTDYCGGNMRLDFEQGVGAEDMQGSARFQTQGADGGLLGNSGKQSDPSSVHTRGVSLEKDSSELFNQEAFTEKTTIHCHKDPTIIPRPVQESYPSPVDSPPANMDQFRPQTIEGSSGNFLHSSPILSRSNKIYTHQPTSRQTSFNNTVDYQTPLSLADPGSPHTHWPGMSILPLVACPHHHDLPVIDAPGSFSPTLVRCHTPDCGKTAALDIARHMYKNCHNCRGTYYCSRKCRRQDWTRHKRDVCHGSRVSSACKRVIKFCGLDPGVKAALSRLARRGFLSRGRGCVMLGFPDLCATEEFLLHGLKLPRKQATDNNSGGSSVSSSLELLPVYVTLSELRGSKMYGGGEVLQRLMTLCETYNPELKFLLNVGIGVRWNRKQISGPQTFNMFMNGQDRSFQYTTKGNEERLSRVDIEMFTTHEPSTSQSCNESSKDRSLSFHSTTIDSGYNELQRSPSARNQRLNSNSPRSRSASVLSEDVGYGSLGDIRESLSHSQLSPSHSSFLENSVFYNSQPLGSPPFSFPLSPPGNIESVVYYSDAEPRLRCPILQKCACLRLFNPAFDPAPSLDLAPLNSRSQVSNKISLPIVPIKNFPKYSRLLWPRRCAPTLILTDIPGSWYEAQEEFRLRSLDSRCHLHSPKDLDTDRKAVQRKARELCFSNIQRRLRQRGVSLRRQFPEVYAELVDYVAGTLEHFPSRIIFPVERHGAGKMFTCFLMPEAEPDLRWAQSAQLLDNLDISRDRVWGPLISAQGVEKPQSSSGAHKNFTAGSCPRPHSTLSQLESKKSLFSNDEIHEDNRSLENSTAYHSDMQHIGEQNLQEVVLNQQYQDFRREDSDSATETKAQECSHCQSKPVLVDRWTQTGVPMNSKKINLSVPELIKFCPTSAFIRRKFNTNFPIFSFDPDILDDLLSSWAQDARHFSDNQSTLRPFLLGHRACSSLLLRYQTYKDVSTEITARQCPVESTLPNTDHFSMPAQCPVGKSCFGHQTSYKHSEVPEVAEHSMDEQDQKITKGQNLISLEKRKKKKTKPHHPDHFSVQTESAREATSAVPGTTDHSFPSQDQVDSILDGWRKSSLQVQSHQDGKNSSIKLDNLPWSCGTCSDRHPHNHPYRDPSCVHNQVGNHGKLTKSVSVQYGNSNPKSTFALLYPSIPDPWG